MNDSLSADAFARLGDTTRDAGSAKREQLREAIAAVQRRGDKPTVTRVQKVSGLDRTLVAAVCRDFREGRLPPVTESWRDPAPGSVDGAQAGEAAASLADLIAEADNAERLAKVGREIARLVALGVLDESRARTLKQVLEEQRRALNDHHKQKPQEADEQMLVPVTQAGLEVVQAYMGICNGRRRMAIRRFVDLQAEADIAESPNVDVETLPGENPTPPWVALRLDAQGEPIEGRETVDELLEQLELGEDWDGAWIRGDYPAAEA